MEHDHVTSAVISEAARDAMLALHPELADAFTAEDDGYRMYGFVSQINLAVALGAGRGHDPIDFHAAPPRIHQLELPS